METNAPEGWYEDGSGSQLRYWDGARWTDEFAPRLPAPASTSVVPSPGSDQKRERTGGPVLGIVGIVAAVLGLFGVVLPWIAAETAGILLLIAAFALSGIAAARAKRRWIGAIGLGIAAVGTAAGFVMFAIGLAQSLGAFR
ncbi:MAG TPA: DUF2510 domain-containing protein [Microbacterium sp.]|nr:DUF2510 domain-containing protein [Microbacterium sp.]